jgi:hypothetical protein
LGIIRPVDAAMADIARALLAAEEVDEQCGGDSSIQGRSGSEQGLLEGIVPRGKKIRLLTTIRKNGGNGAAC